MCGVIKTAMARLICSKVTNNYLLNTITVYIGLQIQPLLNARDAPSGRERWQAAVFAGYYYTYYYND